MMRRLCVFAIGMVALVMLAACKAMPTQMVEFGDTLATANFDDLAQWETYVNPARKVEFTIRDGSYQARAWDGGFTWTLNDDLHTAVVIQADVEQVSDYADNAFGLMCRASPTNNGDGYFFFISGDGYYTFRRGAAKEVLPIIQWTHTDAIRQGRAINRIRIVCVDDYLALYVNGEFVDEARDTLFATGYAGLSAAVPEGGEVSVRFDDVIIREATLVHRPSATPSSPLE